MIGNKINTQSGQALLLVLVGMGSVLVMALSVISRSITDISLSGKEDESSRAFSAAEAGIEHLLVSTSVIPYVGVGVTASVSYVSQGSGSYFLPQKLLSGETGTVWFVSHTDTGEKLTCTAKPCYKSSSAAMDVYWGDVGTSDIPALEVVVYYDSGASPKQAIASDPSYSNVRIKRFIYDINAGVRDNGFLTSVTTGSAILDGTAFKYHLSAPINLTTVGPAGCSNINGCLLMAKVRLLYNSVAQSVAVSVGGSSTLPAQAKKLESVGTSGESTRKVELIQTYKEPFSVFESGLYSGVSLDKEI